MATQITNYQCPACTGPLHFVGESGKLECDYCGSSFDIAEIEAFYAEKEAKAAEAAQKREETEAAQKSAEAEEQKAAADGSDWDSSGLSEDWGADAADMKAYCCPSCGAELLCDATTAATSRTVQRHFEARFCAALQAEQGGCHQGIEEALSQKASAAIDLLQSQPSGADQGCVCTFLDVRR